MHERRHAGTQERGVQVLRKEAHCHVRERGTVTHVRHWSERHMTRRGVSARDAQRGEMPAQDMRDEERCRWERHQRERHMMRRDAGGGGVQLHTREGSAAAQERGTRGAVARVHSRKSKKWYRLS